jgi:galactose oxidase
MSDIREAARSDVTPEQQRGQWGPVLEFANSAIHSQVLPNGRVLMWGRRDSPSGSLDEHECTPFVWDPADPMEPGDPHKAKTESTSQPVLSDGTKVNVFCGGHAFLADGRLLVVGGHLFDGVGVDQAAIYDAEGDAGGTWTPTAPMGKGRWYPTATTLPDGGVLVLSGSYRPSEHEGSRPNRDVQVWRDGNWTQLAPLPDELVPDLYPRTHVLSDGRVFVSGPLKETWLLTLSNGGRWDRADAPRQLGQCDYAPAVMYDVDKIIFVGGGGEPTARCETIDFTQPGPHWVGAREEGMKMHFPRRQHNATLLPDGTVLVTGGTRGAGFNDIRPGRPVHAAELWDPVQRTWTELASESVNRCYHATAVLLPDATVLSAGGGEFKIPGDQPNPPQDTHRDGQVFRPPYLFKGDRPIITAAPTAPVGYGETFEIGADRPEDIAKVSWIRLPSVTHAYDQSQRINFLEFSVRGTGLAVTTPKTPNACPPGPYMLFALNRNGVPSVATIMLIQAGDGPAGRSSAEAATSAPVFQDPYSRQADQVAAARGTSVIVGLTSTCPYGLSACWGGAYEAMTQLEGVAVVNPIADADDSTAEVIMSGGGLPPLQRWVDQFRAIVNERYAWRGVEVTLTGVVEERNGTLLLRHGDEPVVLAPLGRSAKLQWDNVTRDIKPVDMDEASAYDRLGATLSGEHDQRAVAVTGPLHQSDSEYRLAVRRFTS